MTDRIDFLPALVNALVPQKKDMRPVSDRGWLSIIRESFPGAWQTNYETDFSTVLSYHAVFACMTLIAGDISKLRVKVVEQDENGIWHEITHQGISPVLRRPNHFQTRIQFFEHWVLSKLSRGNVYVLKQRNGRGGISALYVLDPQLTKPLVADNGDVYYELLPDALSRIGITERLVVPASEIIHDRMNCIFHPLVGIAPIFASGVVATHGISIQKSASWFFGNKSIPGGVLTAPGHITDETAARLKETFETKFGGDNSGKIAVVGDGLKFMPMSISASDSQLIEQLRYTAEIVCSTFHVPPYKIGVGQMPTYNNIQALNLEYYQQALQKLIEAMELCLDDGFNTGEGLGTEFDLDGLLRMDAKTMMEVVEKGVGSGVWKPNEGRAKFDLPPVEGGDTPYLQQQNFSLAALAKRDADDPFSKPEPAPPAPPALPTPEEEEAELRALIYGIRGRLEDRLNV